MTALRPAALLLLCGCYEPALSTDAKGLDAPGAGADALATDAVGPADTVDAPGTVDAPTCDVVFGPYTTNFDDNLYPAGTTPYLAGSGSMLSASTGALHVTLTAGTTSAGAGLASTSAFDFIGKAFVVRLVDPAPGGGGEAYLAIQTGDGSEWFGILQNGTALRWGDNDAFATTTWNSSERWWRILEAGQLAFEVSQDGLSWRRLGVLSTPTWIGAATIDLGAGYYAGTPLGTTTIVTFDDLNSPPCAP